MATPAAIVVVTIAITTLAALAMGLVLLLRHLQGLLATLRSVQQDLEPTLTALRADVEVTQRELERVSEAAAQLGSAPGDQSRG